MKALKFINGLLFAVVLFGCDKKNEEIKPAAPVAITTTTDNVAVHPNDVEHK